MIQYFKFHPLNLDDIASKIQRPKIDQYSDHNFIVLHFPVFDKTNMDIITIMYQGRIS